MSDAELYLSVGEALKAKRTQRGVSARALSAASGKSPTYVGKVESGDINLTFQGFCELAKHLELSKLEILFLVKLGGE